MQERYTVRDAARYLDIDERTISHHLRKGHLVRDWEERRAPSAEPRAGGRRYFTREALDAFRTTRFFRTKPADWEAITRRYHAGETANALGAEFGVDPVRIRIRVGSRKPRLSEETWAEIQRRRQAGEFVTDLSREFGVSGKRIYARTKAG